MAPADSEDRTARVKVCGICRFEDALLALDEGAWALGFIFHRSSPRFIAPDYAADLIADVRQATSREFLAVGVFVDWPRAELQRVVDSAGLDVAQLHGAEAPQYVAKVRAREVWKALHVGDGFDVAEVERYPAATRILLDTFRRGEAGGTGETFDWELARAANQRRPIVLAGGIGPDNVADALERVCPEAIDVSSGVEARPGEKDAEKVRALFRNVAFSTSD
jgi:phosphoribosylanthranilate isomerase